MTPRMNHSAKSRIMTGSAFSPAEATGNQSWSFGAKFAQISAAKMRQQARRDRSNEAHAAQVRR